MSDFKFWLGRKMINLGLMIMPIDKINVELFRQGKVWVKKTREHILSLDFTENDGGK